MSYRMLASVTALLFALGIGFAHADDPVPASRYDVRGGPGNTRGPGIAPMAIVCGPWSNWITTTSYCKIDAAGAACLCTTRPLSVQFDDQYQRRTCTNTVMGYTNTEYRFRTIRGGCCGLTIFPCDIIF